MTSHLVFQVKRSGPEITSTSAIIQARIGDCRNHYMPRLRRFHAWIRLRKPICVQEFPW